MKKLWSKQTLRTLALVLSCVFLLTCLSGFASPAVQSGQSGGITSVSTVRERIKRLQQKLKEQQKDQSSSSSQPEEKPAEPEKNAELGKPAEPVKPAEPEKNAKPAEELKALPTVEGIARLAGLRATVETKTVACYVDVDNGENPYDVTWDYGELYNLYVGSVNWSLLFDADYYIQTFPVLAYLYHNDKELLLRHFQTVGIHEGRQGREEFNVAAYMANCGSSIQKAFGDNYECYYLYYAMNHANQKKVTTTDPKAKKQLTVKLTKIQQTELDNLNKYRDEKGIAPLTYDPELAAFACYRAYIDALEDWDAHDWLESDDNTEEIYGLMDLLHINHLSENTVHSYRRYEWDDTTIFHMNWYAAYYINYRYSPDHYKAIIKPDNLYVGCANAYLSAYEKENLDYPDTKAVSVQFDVFTEELTTPMNG